MEHYHNYEGPFILKAELAHTQNEDEPQPIFVFFFMTGSCNSLHKKKGIILKYGYVDCLYLFLKENFPQLHLIVAMCVLVSTFVSI